MGWLDGAKLLRPTGDTPHSLEEFRGMKVAVDISYYFHVAVRVPAAVAQYHAAPPVPVTGIIPSLRRIVDIANTFGIELVAVTDGTRHPGKAAVDESRAAAVASSIASITPLLAADRPADFNEVKKLRASASYVRADVLKVAIDYLKSQGVECVGAPFEADWQCAHLESISLHQFLRAKVRAKVRARARVTPQQTRRRRQRQPAEIEDRQSKGLDSRQTNFRHIGIFSRGCGGFLLVASLGEIPY